MNTFQQIGIAILVVFIIHFVVGIRGHKLKMRMKQFVNGMVWVGGIILAMYVILLGMTLIPKVEILVQDTISSGNFGENTILVLHGLPFAFVIMILGITVWFIGKSFTYKIFKFNDEDAKFIKAEDTETMSKIKKVFGFKEKQRSKED